MSAVSVASAASRAAWPGLAPAASVSCTVISRVQVGDTNAPDEATRAAMPVVFDLDGVLQPARPMSAIGG
jgi:hypothetical protein